MIRANLSSASNCGNNNKTTRYQEDKADDYWIKEDNTSNNYFMDAS
jgi:hypothetical protein